MNYPTTTDIGFLETTETVECSNMTHKVIMLNYTNALNIHFYLRFTCLEDIQQLKSKYLLEMLQFDIKFSLKTTYVYLHSSHTVVC